MLRMPRAVTTLFALCPPGRRHRHVTARRAVANEHNNVIELELILGTCSKCGRDVTLQEAKLEQARLTPDLLEAWKHINNYAVGLLNPANPNAQAPQMYGLERQIQILKNHPVMLRCQHVYHLGCIIEQPQPIIQYRENHQLCENVAQGCSAQVPTAATIMRAISSDTVVSVNNTSQTLYDILELGMQANPLYGEAASTHHSNSHSAPLTYNTLYGTRNETSTDPASFYYGLPASASTANNFGVNHYAVTSLPGAVEPSGPTFDAAGYLQLPVDSTRPTISFAPPAGYLDSSDLGLGSPYGAEGTGPAGYIDPSTLGGQRSSYLDVRPASPTGSMSGAGAAGYIDPATLGRSSPSINDNSPAGYVNPDLLGLGSGVGTDRVTSNNNYATEAELLAALALARQSGTPVYAPLQPISTQGSMRAAPHEYAQLQYSAPVPVSPLYESVGNPNAQPRPRMPTPPLPVFTQASLSESINRINSASQRLAPISVTAKFWTRRKIVWLIVIIILALTGVAIGIALSMGLLGGGSSNNNRGVATTTGSSSTTTSTIAPTSTTTSSTTTMTAQEVTSTARAITTSMLQTTTGMPTTTTIREIVSTVLTTTEIPVSSTVLTTITDMVTSTLTTLASTTTTPLTTEQITSTVTSTITQALTSTILTTTTEPTSSTTTTTTSSTPSSTSSTSSTTSSTSSSTSSTTSTTRPTTTTTTLMPTTTTVPTTTVNPNCGTTFCNDRPTDSRCQGCGT